MNAFELASSYTQTPKAPKPNPATEAKPTESSKKHWRIITQSAEIQARLVDMVNELGDAEYGETVTPFAERQHVSAAISEEMAMAIFSGSDPDYILLYRPGPSYMWSLSEKYTRGDLKKYFGQKMERVYKSATPPLSGPKK